MARLLLIGAAALILGVCFGYRLARAGQVLKRLTNLDDLYDVNYGDEETR